MTFCDKKLDMHDISVIDWAKKKYTLVSGNAGDKKNLHPGGRKFFFFLIDFSGVFFFLLLVSFPLFDSCFCLFVCSLLFGIKYVYMWVGKRKKNFHPANFRKQDYFFWPWCIPFLSHFLNPDTLISYTEHMTSNSILW